RPCNSSVAASPPTGQTSGPACARAPSASSIISRAGIASTTCARSRTVTAAPVRPGRLRRTCSPEGGFMSFPRTLRPDPDVVDTELGEGEVALLHLGTRTYFSLNVTGARVWHHLKRGLTLDE